MEFVDGLADGQIVTITTSDTAIAKSRPLGPEIYNALRQLGAPKDCEIIGRCPIVDSLYEQDQQMHVTMFVNESNRNCVACYIERH